MANQASLRNFNTALQLRAVGKHAEAYEILTVFEGTNLDDATYWGEMATVLWHLDKARGAAYLYKILSQQSQPGVARYIKTYGRSLCASLSWYEDNPWRKSVDYLVKVEE